MISGSKYILVTIISISSFFPLNAKVNDWWLNAGFGQSTIDGDGGLTAYGSFNYTVKNRIIKARTYIASEFDILGDTPSVEIWEYGLLYGLYSDNERESISITAGLAFTGGTLKGDFIEQEFFGDRYEKINWETVGIPVEVQINFNVFNYAGVNFTAFANLNIEKSIAGINLNILIGKLR